jgi:hypothetical protein
MTFKTTASPTQAQQVQAIITNLENQLKADGLGDVAAAVIPQLQNLETTSNAGELVLEGPAIIASLGAAGPKLEQQTINLVAAALVAIMGVYIPAPAPAA